MEDLKEKEWYRDKIVEIVGGIKNPDIVRAVYIFVSDIAKEDNR